MLCTYRGTCKGLQLRHFYWPEVPPQKFCQDIWQLYLRKFTKNGKLLEMELGNSILKMADEDESAPAPAPASAPAPAHHKPWHECEWF